MKNKIGLIFPVFMLIFGAYALITVLGTTGEQVALIRGQEIPRGLAMMFGLICLGGGVFATISVLSKKNSRVVVE
jgi:hypothetical protein